MTAYAIAQLRPATVNEDVLRYLEVIQETMDPYGGRFLVHGAEVEIMEGSWPGTVVIIEFPDLAAIRDYHPRMTAAKLRDALLSDVR